MAIQVIRAPAAIVLLAFFALVGCAAQLAPPASDSIAAELNAANESTLVLFSALAGGSTKSEFSKHSATYDSLIGRFEALKIRSEARSVPPLPAAARRVFARLGDKAPCQDIAACQNPTPQNLETVVRNLKMLRDTHREHGLLSGQVELFTGDYKLAITRALAFETMLLRE